MNKKALLNVAKGFVGIATLVLPLVSSVLDKKDRDEEIAKAVAKALEQRAKES